MLRRNGALLDSVDPYPPADTGGNDVDTNVGTKVRGLRKERKMSLTDLAEATGLSVGFLSQVERDKSNPSVKALHDISRALGVNITWFFESTQESPVPPTGPIVRVRERKKIHYGVDICDELLSPASSEQLELIWSRFAPGSSSGTQPYDHDGEEAGVVLSGVLELVIGDTVHILKAGDSFGFKSRTPHRYSNPGTVDTIVVWAVTPPTY